MSRIGDGTRKVLAVAAIAVAGTLLVAPVGPAQAHGAVRGRAHAVTFHSFAPRGGPMGTTVTIVGTGFTGATSVWLHGVRAQFSVVSATKISVVVPCHTSTGRFTVRTPHGSARSFGSFRIT